MRPLALLQALPSSAPSTVSVLSALVTTLAAIAVFASVWRVERERWLGWLMVTWFLWAARYVVGAVPQTVWPVGSGALDSPIGIGLFLLRDAAFVLTLFHLGARGTLAAWLASLLPLALALGGLTAAQSIREHADAYLFIQHALFWAFGAAVIAASARLDRRARYLAAAGLLAHAIVVAGSAWPGDSALWNSLGLGLSSLVHVSVALGVGIGVHKRLLDEREAAELRVARALEYAVRGHVPMCAHCRSVRGPDGAWTTLERFVEQRTESAVVDTRCPDCRARAIGAQAITAP